MTPSAAEVGPSPRPVRRLSLHLALFAATFLSALIAQVPRRPGEGLVALAAEVARDPARLAVAWPFAVTLMAILVAHEAGHWLVARHYGIAQSLPFFLPAPMFCFGTLGAVIVTRQAVSTRAILLRMAAAGPLAGMAVALPAAVWGLSQSQPLEAATHSGPARMFGRSLLFGLLEDTVGPGGPDILLHPVALAAWAGFFITSLNLIPAAQLDGGHISYALFGSGHRRLGRWVVAGLCLLGVSALGAKWALGANESGAMWLLWALVLGLIGLRHPEVVSPEVPIARADRRLGAAALALFVLTFVPLPMQEVFIEVRPLSHGEEAWPGPSGAEEEYDL